MNCPNDQHADPDNSGICIRCRTVLDDDDDQAINTNDPQAPYTVKLNGPIESSTAPLLSSEQIIDGGYWPEVGMRFKGPMSAFDVRNWYEAKIASGELMVCKTATIDRDPPAWFCSQCEAGTFEDVQSEPKVGSYCTNCGAKIIEGEPK